MVHKFRLSSRRREAHVARVRPVSLHRLELGVGDESRKSQIRMVGGFAEAAETKYILVAAACNHPNLLVLRFRFELIRG